MFLQRLETHEIRDMIVPSIAAASTLSISYDNKHGGGARCPPVGSLSVATGSPLDGSSREGNVLEQKSSVRSPTATVEACAPEGGIRSRSHSPTGALAQSSATLDLSPELRLATGRHRDRLGESVGWCLQRQHLVA